MRIFPERKQSSTLRYKNFCWSHQLSTEQEKIRNIEEGITKIYSELPLIYLMGSPFQTVRTPQTDSIGAEGVEATFMLEAILIRQKPEILRVMEFIEKDNKKNRALYDLIMSNFEFFGFAYYRYRPHCQ